MHGFQVPGRALSGGQRSRLAMAAVSFCRPHVLILDEPTNNLDIEAVEALATAVEGFEGACVIVSHDHYFVSRVAQEVWVVEGSDDDDTGGGGGGGGNDGGVAAASGHVRRLDSFAAYIEAAHARANLS